MQRRTNIQASTLIILLSIITILAQFVTYYFFEAFYVVWGISVVLTIISCHILVEQTSAYESCFNYSLITMFISLVVTLVTYFGKVQTFLPYSGIMLGIVVINWLLPMMYCFLRYMFDYGSRADDFTVFYRNHSIIFLLFYSAAILYGSFAGNAFPWAYRAIGSTANFIPFSIISSQIEDYLYQLIPLGDIFTYVLSRVLIYLPYGFYITLLLRRQGRLPRLFALLLLPFLVEVFQFIFIRPRCDIDDLIYAFLGGILGTVIYFLMNVIFRAVSGRDFLAKDNEFRFSSSPLHF